LIFKTATGRFNHEIHLAPPDILNELKLDKEADISANSFLAVAEKRALRFLRLPEIRREIVKRREKSLFLTRFQRRNSSVMKVCNPPVERAQRTHLIRDKTVLPTKSGWGRAQKNEFILCTAVFVTPCFICAF
jgi:hypothetical protein